MGYAIRSARRNINETSNVWDGIGFVADTAETVEPHRYEAGGAV